MSEDPNARHQISDATMPPELELRVAPPTGQNRLTVLVRVILALPHLVVLGLLGYVVLFVTILGWFAALFVGRNPFHRFVVGYLRWSIRVSGYVYLLTDRYPPFSMDLAPTYPVDADVVQGPLRRLTVLFRLLLVIPASLLTSVLQFGMGVLSFFAWIIAVVRGSLPEPLHVGFAATIRFNARVQSYMLLAQDRYPSRLFGDGDADVTPPASRPEVDATSGTGTVSTGTASGTSSLPAYSGRIEPFPQPRSVEQAIGTWPLAISRGGRRTVISEIVLGALAWVGYVVVIALVLSIAASEQSWSNSYAGYVEGLDESVTLSGPSLIASPTNWHSVQSDCQTVEIDIVDFGNAPQYPSAVPNRQLVSGLSWIIKGDGECLRSVVPHRDAAGLRVVAQDFARGARELGTFLGEIPTPFE